MPKLKDFRRTKEISLSKYPDSKVVIYDSILVSDMNGLDITGQDFDSNIKNVVKFIKSWNFTDDQGNDCPISCETLKQFDSVSFTELIEAIGDFANLVKKNS